MVLILILNCLIFNYLFFCRGKDEKSAHFLSEKVEVVEFACADESQMNVCFLLL